MASNLWCDRKQATDSPVRTILITPPQPSRKRYRVHYRARSKQVKDILREYLRAQRNERERIRAGKRDELDLIFAAAYNDHLGSKGEVVALTNSDSIDIQRGDVLRDKKLPSYEHPTVRAIILREPDD